MDADHSSTMSSSEMGGGGGQTKSSRGGDGDVMKRCEQSSAESKEQSRGWSRWGSVCSAN
eukprot:2709999-Rhodomonas_salina.5